MTGKGGHKRTSLAGQALHKCLGLPPRNTHVANATRLQNDRRADGVSTDCVGCLAPMLLEGPFWTRAVLAGDPALILRFAQRRNGWGAAGSGGNGRVAGGALP